MEVSLFIYNNNVMEKLFLILQHYYWHECKTGHIHKNATQAKPAYVTILMPQKRHITSMTSSTEPETLKRTFIPPKKSP